MGSQFKLHLRAVAFERIILILFNSDAYGRFINWKAIVLSFFWVIASLGYRTLSQISTSDSPDVYVI